MMKINNSKVLMIAPTPFFSDRGCHIRILNSYLSLKRDKNKILILTYPLGRNLKYINIRRTIPLLGYKKTSPGFSFYKPVLDFLLLLMTIFEEGKSNYPIIYGHLHEGALIGIISKKFFNVKVVFDAQGSLTGELLAHKTIKNTGLISMILLKIESFIYKNSDEIVTSTLALKNYLIEKFNVPKNKIIVVEDIPDKSIFNKRVTKVKIDLPKGKKIIVYLGGMQFYKGIDYLIKAIPLTNKNIHFLLMGYPNEDAIKLASALGVSNRITFVGSIPYEKAAAYLRVGDIAISPKTLESKEANAKLYNYLAVGLKVICFDTKENRDILKSKGIYAKEKSFKDLAKKMNWWVNEKH